MRSYGRDARMNILLKAKYSAISAIVFFIVANPEMYKFTQMMFGSYSGLFLHTAIFFFAMLALMLMPAT